MTTPLTAANALAERELEYGQYTAVEAIYLGGALAFNAGDPVPASHVTRGVVNAAQVTKSKPSKTTDPAVSATEKG